MCNRLAEKGLGTRLGSRVFLQNDFDNRGKSNSTTKEK